jgi:tyrocidine synthetase-3
MIIKKFEEIVKCYPGKAALKTGSKSLTYAELNFSSNRVAHAIGGKDKEVGSDVEKQQVALLFDYGIDMIVGLLGALKANKTYVPLDISYPGKRLLYILENAEAYLILTDKRNHELACELSGHAGRKISVLNINSIEDEIPGTDVDRESSGERAVYILYTSGSTGKPKGIMQIHRNVIYYARNWIKRFSITENDRMSLFTAFTHDGAIPDIYSALLSGACLYPYSIKENGSVDELGMLLEKERITIWHSTPTLFRYFTGALTEKDHFPGVRWVLLGGEPLRAHDLELYKNHFTNAFLVNVYGQTESTVSSLCVLSPYSTFDDVFLGEPLEETKIFLMDEDGDPVEDMRVGEIVVACDYIAPGYWKDKESSEKVFFHDEQRGRIYRTGDMGRFNAQGTIKMMGRKDFQVKIRGFRIELEEIESGLLQHSEVDEAIVIARGDENDEDYLCAYIVTNHAISSEALRDYLFSELPDYMIPRYFIFLEKMPMTSSGKIDRRRLPEPGKIIDSRSTYVAPSNEIEEKVAAIWQEVLKVEKIGINDNFIELGGHSLLIMSIISKIHREFDVELQLTDVFENPTVKQLARLITDTRQTAFLDINPVEEKEYFPLSPTQKRLYILNMMDANNISYYISSILELKGKIKQNTIEETFKKLIERHESLRISIEMVGKEPVQRIHDHVELNIEFYELNSSFPPAGNNTSSMIERTFAAFISPFDLSRAPLLKVGLIEVEEENYILMVYMHHIVTDRTSQGILSKEFLALCAGEELPPLRLQYKDYSEWQRSQVTLGAFKIMEEYWLKQFNGEIPMLNITTDYPRPRVKSSEGEIIRTYLGEEDTRGAEELSRSEGTTLFMVLLTIYYILLSKMSHQKDIVVGTTVAGRSHPDLEEIIGAFLNTIALRNYPSREKTFTGFLKEVKKNTLEAFENQDYQFDDLVQKVALSRGPNRNLLFDVMFDFNPGGAIVELEEKDPQYEIKKLRYEIKGSMVDFILYTHPANDRILLLIQYCTKIYKRETVQTFLKYYERILKQVIKNKEIKIRDIELMDEEEKVLIHSGIQRDKEEIKVEFRI